MSDSAVLNRRSIRKYSSQPLEDGVLEEVVRAGMAAPSAHNAQPWHFLVIDQREILDAITGVHPHSKMLKEAPAAILICGEPALSKTPQYIQQDCAAAVMSMLIRISEMGLGSVWMGVHPVPEREEEMRALFKLPEGIIPFALIAVGHPAEEKGPSGRFMAERIHHNKW